VKPFLVAVFMLVLIAAPRAVIAQAVRPSGLTALVGEALKNVVIPEEDEIKIGASIAEALRTRYGVVQENPQNPPVHRYVSLVGRALAAESGRPKLPWTFIVLDTPAVNAMSAPGGFVLITRGALALIPNEAELAGVLAHEVAHVTLRHVIAEIRKQTGMKMLGDRIPNEDVRQYVDAGIGLVKNNLWKQPEELAADTFAVMLATGVGYAPSGLGDFLEQLKKRNEQRTGSERNGLFSTHPEIKERSDALAKTIADRRLVSESFLEDRYKSVITYKPASIEQVAGELVDQLKKNPPKPAAPGAPATWKDNLTTVTQAYIPEIAKLPQQDASVAAARNVNVDADAPGGSNPNPVPVEIKQQELDAFRNAIEG
jgi:predicted Zn-dependent protease